MRTLDAHLHLWDPERLEYPWLDGALRGRFGPEELAESTADDTAERAYVFVQADCVPSQTLDEVEWVSGLAQTLPIRGIVAGGRLDRGEQTRAHLEALAAHPLVVGVRHLLQGEPDGLARTEAFLAGAAALADRGWSFDACVRAHQLPDVTALAAAVPRLRIVLDHLGKPEVGTAAAPAEPAADWVRDLHELAAHPQVHCKLSGLPAEASGSWSAAQLTPFLDAAASAFGPDRLMLGSDWPVSAVAGDRVDAAATAAWTAFVASWAESRALPLAPILHDTAARFYRLP